VALLFASIFLSCPAMSLSDTDKAIVKLAAFSALDNTGDFNFGIAKGEARSPHPLGWG